jgi:amidase
VVRVTSTTELVQWDAHELSRRIHERAIACREIMSAYLQHIEQLNPHVNAIVSMRDPELLLQEADAADDALRHGSSKGWMHGFPHAVKDLASTRGIPTTQGSPLFATVVPEHDAVVVERIRRAGAIFIGKTNVPEFGLGSQTYNQVFGPTRNAYAQDRTAGGSSGGAAVSLALRMLPVADGSDMGGSLRNPAAYNNVFGFRPSMGRVPRGPAPEVFLQQFSVEGPLARTVGDLARLLSVQAGYDARWPLSLGEDPAAFAASLDADLVGTRVAWIGDWRGHLPMEDGVLDLCRLGLAALESIGCSVEEALPDFDPEAVWQAWLTLRQWLTTGSLGPHYADPVKRSRMKPEAQWEVENGLHLSAQDVFHASEVRSAWYASVLSLFSDFDVLALPSAQVFPFDVETHWPKQVAGVAMDTYHRWMEVTVPATMAGLPAISVPVGFNAEGLPMGMQLIGRPRADLKVLQLARGYEQATQWVQRRPPPLLESLRRVTVR